MRRMTRQDPCRQDPCRQDACRSAGLRLRRRGAASALGLGLVVWIATAGRAAAGACPTAGPDKAVVAAVGERLELQLVDGRRLRLVGLDPAGGTPTAPDRDEQGRRDLGSRLVGHSLEIQLLAEAPDRWGRLPALAFAGDDAPGGVAGAALAAGWGRYLPEPAASACRDGLVAAEASARAARLGLWADPYYAILAVDDRAGFAERTGTLVVAEGRLASVTMSPYRTKLILRSEAPEARRGQLLSATLVPHVAKMFEARGLRVEALVGRKLRLRGLLDLRFGPQIELAGPDGLDVLDAAAGPQGK